MPILSDRQIRERCVAPTHRLDAKKYYELVVQPQAVSTVHHADLRASIQASRERDDALRQKCMVPLTEEEIAAFKPMIEPFNDGLIREMMGSITKPMGHPMQMVTIPTNTRKIISRGLTSFGYDVSLAREFKLFTNINSTIIDPKRLDDSTLVDATVQYDPDGSAYVIMPPNSYLLGRTLEYFRIPRDIQTICVGKSTYARAGAIINVTPIEPGFEGNVVIEIANATSLPMKVYAEEGISQFMFLQGSEECEISYADRSGKYQGQTGITLPKV